jgi:phosphatidylethanolamine-binding protein (PEBP) family uncharacterized protein
MVLAGGWLSQVGAQETAKKAATGPGLTLTTPAFADGGEIPAKFTQSGPKPISPRLQWNNVPSNTASFAKIMHDPDVAVQRKTDDVLHWLVFNIPGSARELDEGVSADQTDGWNDTGKEPGWNSWLQGARSSGRGSASSLHL